MASTATTARVPDLSDLLTPKELSHDALRHLIGLAERPGIKLIDWERLGRPGIDRFVATVNVAAKEVGHFVHDLYAVPGLHPKITGFPNGIPSFEGVRLHIEVTAR